MPNTRSMKIAKKVLNLLKKETKSLHDIIPFNDLPFLYPSQMNSYIDRFGSEKMAAYLQHSEQTSKVRTQAKQLFPIYANTIPYPGSTLKVAMSLCGFGECDETSQRAAIELLAKGCEESINLIVLRGKPCVSQPDPGNSLHYYTHMIVVIGAIPVPYNRNPHAFFQNLTDSHILLDSSLKLIGAANKTPEILESIFRHFEINQVAEVVDIKPQTIKPVAFAKNILTRAEVISEIIMKKLNITKIIKLSNQDMFFSHPKNKYKDLKSKPTSLLVDDNHLDWDTAMKRYKP